MLLTTSVTFLSISCETSKSCQVRGWNRCPVRWSTKRHTAGYPGRGASLQAGSKYPEERKAPRGRNLGGDTRSDQGVGGARRRPLSRRVCFPVGETEHSPLPGQSLAPLHVSKAGEGRAWVGNVSGAEEDKRQPFKKAGVDPKVASDQRGHGLGVSLEVY